MCPALEIVRKASHPASHPVSHPASHPGNNGISTIGQNGDWKFGTAPSFANCTFSGGSRHRSNTQWYAPPAAVVAHFLPPKQSTIHSTLRRCCPKPPKRNGRHTKNVVQPLVLCGTTRFYRRKCALVCVVLCCAWMLMAASRGNARLSHCLCRCMCVGYMRPMILYT